MPKVTGAGQCASLAAVASKLPNAIGVLPVWAKAARESRAYSPRRKRSCSLMLLIIYAPHYYAYTYTANHGPWSIGAGDRFYFASLLVAPEQRSLIAIR